jgi:hypothetical protein
MSKAASSFRRTDVKRAVQAVESAGVKIGRIELEKGKIIIFPDSAALEEPPEEDGPPNSFDQVLGTR